MIDQDDYAKEVAKLHADIETDLAKAKADASFRAGLERHNEWARENLRLPYERPQEPWQIVVGVLILLLILWAAHNGAFDY